MTVYDFHMREAEHFGRTYRFDPQKPYEEQKEAMYAKYREILGCPEKKTDPTAMVEWTEDMGDYTKTRFTFESEPGLFIPAEMLLPKNAENVPVVICLQGHSTGMHISLGVAKYDGDKESIAGDRDYAVQAVKRGYAAVAMEQRNFGELDSQQPVPNRNRCNQHSVQALLMGRTMIGERAFDIGQLICALSSFKELDFSRIGLMGNSGGGTATYYTTALDSRIKAAMPSCSFCTVYGSIFSLGHCICNYIPGFLQYFEMGDLALLIAPRPLVIVAGQKDGIFPIDSVREAFEQAKIVYDYLGASDNIKLIVGDQGHRFYANEAWPVFDKFI